MRYRLLRQDQQDNKQVVILNELRLTIKFYTGRWSAGFTTGSGGAIYTNNLSWFSQTLIVPRIHLSFTAETILSMQFL
jgi:hypothetical protein